MFNSRTKIQKVLTESSLINQQIIVMGWVRTFRNNQFIALNDGSTVNNLQVVAGLGKFPDELIRKINTGASLKVKGVLTPSPAQGQTVELVADQITILGDSNPEIFPLQPKKHSLEFLREIGHLRFRTSTFSAIFRIKHNLAQAVHQFFNNKGFFYIQTPIVTSSDCEGAGEMFCVTTLPLHKIPKNENNEVDYSQDFFGKKTGLTVSGQLEGELAAMGLAEIYTFGPTFRAENSNTTRHLAEFWMIEPEMAFYDLEDNMNLAEEFIKFVINYILTHNVEDLKFLEQRLIDEDSKLPKEQRNPLSLIEKLKFVVENTFVRITYSEAIEILLNSPHYKKKKFNFDISWGIDLQSEHERYLVEKHFQKPVIVTNYPEQIKAFYMRLNDDQKTVAAMDILAPGIGEIVGGSQREERLDLLVNRMKKMNISELELEWYLDTRRFGAVPHAGFGLGFERLTQFVTGMNNIRDVIAFPRTPQNCMF
ncbi:MAG: asparagine--tRNA ligase [Sediminibacterium sp.]|nr:asparagine--tRNA ligase [Sediminibacterium sp.]